jgi:signal transduction histidine kinase/CheY-like chemotaxis protein
VGSISGVLGIFFESPVARALGFAIMLILLPLSVLAHLQVRKDNLDRAVALVASVWYIISFAMIIIGDRLYGVLIVTAILPVLMVLPFVTQSMFRWIIVGSSLLIVGGSGTKLLPTLYTARVPDHIIADVESFSVAILALVVMLSLWQSGGKLKMAASRMRKAIAALQESERSLEHKVEERTAELQRAFREITDLNEVATIVNSTLDVDKVQDTIYQVLQTMFSFDQMGVFLVDNTDNRLRLRLQSGRPFPEALDDHLVHAGLPIEAGDSAAATSVATSTSIFMGEITAEMMTRSGPTDLLIMEHNPLVSILLCPLKIENRSIGCIFFSARNTPFDLSESEITSIERYVMQMGTAIRNAQLFQAAEESRHEAESANETKGTFLANMSHEIRTPMNAIIGLTGLCLQTELTPKQEDYLTKVDSAANALRTIIDDILDFSKLEAGKFEFENIPFSLNDVLDNLATISMVRCQEKHLELVFQRDPTLPDTLMGDPTRLGQILINLTGNAIKFTEEGQIVVEVRPAKLMGDTVSIDFDVRDSGIGMTEEQLGRLFQSFSQADATISRQYGGTGLGLAISQQLAGNMGGEIQVSSTPGVGSSFHFTLTFEVADIEVEALQQEEAPEGLNVLVVDDNEPSRDILSEYLVSFNYTVTLAESGEEALQRLQPGHTFDLVLLDWMMPGMTGLDVALAIRDMPSPPKVVLLSSWQMPSSEHQAMVDAFLAKPVKPSALLDTIMIAYGKQVVRRKRTLMRSTTPEDLATIAGARVLIVDDSDINLQIACELLDKIPLVHDTASNGEEAVAMVRDNSYDCVLMDIQMPGIDGYTATSIIRESLSFDELPILAMTANVMAEDRARTKAAGMNGHVAKPVDPSELYQSLLDSIPDADYSANLSGRDSAPAQAAAQEEAPLPESLPGLDIQQGLSRVGNNAKLYRKLLQDLVDQYGDTGQRVQELLKAGDTDAARGVAHKVRGIANNLGASAVGAAAEAIESAVLESKEVATEQSDTLVAALAEVIESAAQLAQLAQMYQTTAPARNGEAIDERAVLANLRDAIAAFDPSATDLVERLLQAQEPGTEQASRLEQARDLLDGFQFSEAEPFLDAFEQELPA